MRIKFIGRALIAEVAALAMTMISDPYPILEDDPLRTEDLPWHRRCLSPAHARPDTPLNLDNCSPYR